jgi:hypothetical protein
MVYQTFPPDATAAWPTRRAATKQRRRAPTQQLVRFTEAGTGKPLVQMSEELRERQCDDPARGYESLRTAMDQETPVDHPLLNAETQGRPISFAEGGVFHEPKANRLLRGGCNQVDPLHPTGFPLGVADRRGSVAKGRRDVLGDAGPQYGEATASKGLEEPTIPKQHVGTPAGERGQDSDHSGFLERFNAMHDRMVGDIEAPPYC